MGKGPYTDDKYQFKFNFINKIPPGVTLVSKNVFTGEVKRVLNFAALADNKDQIVYGTLRSICEDMCIDHHSLLEEEEKQYNK